jgi:hypothetical protein
LGGYSEGDLAGDGAVSFAKRREDMKRPGVRERIEAFLKEKEAMAEQVKIYPRGEDVWFEADGEAGRCVVRLKLDEAERVMHLLARAIGRATDAEEERLAEEGRKISGVDEDEE